MQPLRKRNSRSGEIIQTYAHQRYGVIANLEHSVVAGL